MIQEQLCILIHYGELGLKGKNQPQFRHRLRNNIRKRLELEGLTWPVEETKTYFTVLVPLGEEPKSDTAVQALRQVFGVAWLARVFRFSHRNFTPDTQDKDFSELYRHLKRMADEQYAPGKTFCVRVKRPNKFVPFKSPELAARLGEWLLDNTTWKKVNVIQPDVTFYLEIHKSTICLFAEHLPGPGGLPVTSAGRVMVLLSGGIDSPVAAYLMARRGCRVDFIHFTAAFADREHLEKGKIWRLVRQLNHYTLGSRLFVVPYTYFDMALLKNDVDYEVVLFRRFMMRVAARLARHLKCQALVTGDNLSQVASQTLSNIAAVTRATELPILQPLLGYDKEEIVQWAGKIGTLDISLEPYKDCCALISRHPRIHSKHELLRELEDRIFPDYQKLIEQTLAEQVCLDARLSAPP